MRRGARAGLVGLVLAVVVACQPALEHASGIVISVDSTAIGQVDGFELLTAEGKTLIFDSTELEFRPEFPPAHLGEHQLIADQVRVTYRTDGKRLIATRVADD